MCSETNTGVGGTAYQTAGKKPKTETDLTVGVVTVSTAVVKVRKVLLVVRCLGVSLQT